MRKPDWGAGPASHFGIEALESRVARAQLPETAALSPRVDCLSLQSFSWPWMADPRLHRRHAPIRGAPDLAPGERLGSKDRGTGGARRCVVLEYSRLLGVNDVR